MTNREYLNNIIHQKNLLLKNIAVLSKISDEENVKEALERYKILNKNCLEIEHLIQSGMLDPDAEKKIVTNGIYYF